MRPALEDRARILTLLVPITLVVETLLDHRDPVAAMALLVQWLGQAEEIPLAHAIQWRISWSIMKR